MAAQRKYITLSKLETFLDKLKKTFAPFEHSHTIDSSLSSTSINPVQNKVVDAEFEAISVAMNALELSVDSTFDLANTAKTNASTAQAKADSAYSLAENVVYVGPTQPTDPNVKVWINTSEEGTGVIPLMPRVSTINLPVSGWLGSAAPYYQQVSINTVTSATKVELNPTVSQIVSLQNDDVALTAENNNGVVTVYSFGGKPSSDMTMQVTLTEVSYV